MWPYVKLLWPLVFVSICPSVSSSGLLEKLWANVSEIFESDWPCNRLCLHFWIEMLRLWSCESIVHKIVISTECRKFGLCTGMTSLTAFLWWMVLACCFLCGYLLRSSIRVCCRPDGDVGNSQPWNYPTPTMSSFAVQFITLLTCTSESIVHKIVISTECGKFGLCTSMTSLMAFLRWMVLACSEAFSCKKSHFNNVSGFRGGWDPHDACCLWLCKVSCLMKTVE